MHYAVPMHLAAGVSRLRRETPDLPVAWNGGRSGGAGMRLGMAEEVTGE
jgi:hypothetical protein